MIGDALGNPLGFTLTGAEQADISQASELLRRVGQSGAVIANKGYDSDALVEDIECAGALAVIPPRGNRIAPRQWDKDRYQARHPIKNRFARLKQFRRLATRYDKRPRNLAAFDSLAGRPSWFGWLNVSTAYGFGSCRFSLFLAKRKSFCIMRSP